MFRRTKPEKTEILSSVVGRHLHMLGNIVYEGGTVDFDGTLDGNLRCEALTLRGNGVINGEIIAHTVRIYGKVNGLIKAKNVHLYSGAYIEGIVMHEQLVIEDGAFIDGKCKRTDKPSEAADAAASAKPLRMMENIRLIS